MMSVDSAMSGTRRADAVDQPEIVGGGVFAVHRGEDAVGACLERQMQIGHQAPECRDARR